MSDLISRQAAIDAIRASTSKYTGFMEMEMYTDNDAVEAINGVPSAEPVRHGKWVIEDGHVCCSECGEISKEYNYCPYCGAKMDEEKENTHD